MAWWSPGTRSGWLSPSVGTSTWAAGTTGTCGWSWTHCSCARPGCARPSAGWRTGCGSTRSTRFCGPVEGGAFLAYAVSDLLTAAFLPGYRTPGETAGYHLPPAPGEIAGDHSRPAPGGIAGWRVGIVDNAVNAGTAVAACAAAVRARDAVPVAVTSLLALGDASEAIPERLGVPFYPAATLPGRTWPAARCKLCVEGIPLSPAPHDQPRQHH